MESETVDIIPAIKLKSKGAGVLNNKWIVFIFYKKQIDTCLLTP
ncbi:MAG: hypothetical protein ABI208_03390 [Ginsengibacter sp.]